LLARFFPPPKKRFKEIQGRRLRERIAVGPRLTDGHLLLNSTRFSNPRANVDPPIKLSSISDALLILFLYRPRLSCCVSSREGSRDIPMKTIEVEKTGGPEVLSLQEIGGLEPPSPGQALVRIVMAGVNFMDVSQRQGIYPRETPFTPGIEAAGVVESVGDGVKTVKPGDRVAYTGEPGAYAEASLVRADRLIPLPDDISFEQGAAFPLQGMTAHYLIHEFRQPRDGDFVLVHAAAGGVGLQLVQWAKHLGAKVIGTVSTEEKAITVGDAGADDVILYTQKDFAKETYRLTGGHGADIIFDGVGKSTFKNDLEAAAPRGEIIVFGASSGPADPISPSALMGKSISLTGGRLDNFISTRADLLRRANSVIQGIREGWLTLHIDRILDLEQAADAHRLLESRETSGKILLAPPADARSQAA
jgi:NADPH2:quinone reductase